MIKEVVQKVICENNNYYPVSLKLGETYEVRIVKESTFIIIDEFFDDQEYPKKIFKIIGDSWQFNHMP